MQILRSWAESQKREFPFTLKTVVSALSSKLMADECATQKPQLITDLLVQ